MRQLIPEYYMFLPKIIQGGMGAGVSSWTLANTVAAAGQLGVVSGTALESVIVRRLQLGDEGGHMRRALAAFPVPEVAQRVIDRYFKTDRKIGGKPLRLIPGFTIDPPASLVDLAIVSNFVEVFLAKEGHNGHVGVNYLEKIQMPNLTSIFGAMLAGVVQLIPALMVALIQFFQFLLHLLAFSHTEFSYFLTSSFAHFAILFLSR